MERNKTFFAVILAIMAVSAHAAQDAHVQNGQHIPELIRAAQSGDLVTVERLVAAGADLEARDEAGNTALIRAVNANQIEVARSLIDARASISARNHRSITPLMCATSAEVAQLLIAAGADVNAVEADGFTALMYASGEEDADLVRTLLQAGAKVNATASGGWTALKSASQSGCMEVVNLLLHRGADVHATGPFSLPALTYAVINEHTEVVDLLLQAGANVNMAVEYDGWNALMFASIHAYIDLARTLIAAGTNLDTVTHRGKTVYSIASEWRHETIWKHETMCALLETACLQPAETLADALKECRYRKQIYDEIERQRSAALERRDQMMSTDPRARALRQKIAYFAEQSKQRLFQAEAALKACQDLALQFVRRGVALNDATVAPLLKDNDIFFEKFHVKLLMLAQSLQPTLAGTIHDKRLVEQHRIFERLFGPDVSARICKGSLPRRDYRQLRALLAQRAQIVNDLQQARQRSRIEQPVLQWRQRPVEQFRPILAALEADQPATSELSAAPRGEACIIL